ncbi:hypothetical protein SPBR_03735 [Sporothrix brasiliensis 5110]|uniref:Tryptophan synthase beta chain-like PALP domain-containing protein n=1 Tax=Sporothrix brasiliensis 5110 TaxID=1398154 RepID=A0A0C2FUZ4_9PEZI|nr:uncharacterized protein SPBR_03735 [Sporothrix brasiliensis 5110]KIH94858.1 hypothetical protein SPBR_03735 [Sporothrix brasiliensis 5110]
MNDPTTTAHFKDKVVVMPDIPPIDTAAVAALHRQLPHYAVTPMHSLPTLAAELGIGHLLLKDESNRFGLPSFKILGASWAVYKALARAVGLPSTGPDAVSLDALAAAVRAHNDRHNRENGLRPLQILSCTEGNWGRAVARMARYAGGVSCRLYVPAFMPQATQALLAREGADVRVVPGANYDDCVTLVRAEADRDSSMLLLLDVGLEDYEDVPQWVVEGYSTLLAEADAQVRQATGGRPATHVVVPVGVGSIAQAVTAHYKAPHGRGGAVGTGQAMQESIESAEALANDVDDDAKGPDDHADTDTPVTSVLTVEADTAACLRASQAVGRRVTVATADTIMCGLNCGTLSRNAWPILHAGVDYSVAVSDRQAHVAVQQLLNADSSVVGVDADADADGDEPMGGTDQKTSESDAAGAKGVAAGPCGAATLAGLRKICSEARDVVKVQQDSVVVLICTEGAREYAVPFV